MAILATEAGVNEWDQQQQQHIKQLEAMAGPPAVRFAEWAAATLWERVRLAAIDMGMGPAQAENVAANVTAGTMRELRTAVRLQRQLKIPRR